MTGEASLKFRLRKIDKTRNYILDEIKHIKHNDLISKNYKKTCKYFKENVRNFQKTVKLPLTRYYL